jgi:cobalt/nickel transport system permease protein
MTVLARTDEAGAGLLQALRPEGQILAAAAFALVAVSLDRLDLLLLALALAALLAILARLPLGPTLRRVLAMDAFMVPVLLLLPATVPGPTIASLGPFELSGAGLRQAVAILLTANAVILAALALIGTIEPARLGHALQRLGVPQKLVSLLLFTVRYVSVLQQDFARMRRAMRARAFVPSSSRHSWRAFGYLFGMLLVRSFERSERIMAAMRCRGFTGRYLLPDAAPAGPADLAFGALVTLALAGLVAAEAWT